MCLLELHPQCDAFQYDNVYDVFVIRRIVQLSDSSYVFDAKFEPKCAKSRYR